MDYSRTREFITDPVNALAVMTAGGLLILAGCLANQPDPNSPERIAELSAQVAANPSAYNTNRTPDVEAMSTNRSHSQDEVLFWIGGAVAETAAVSGLTMYFWQRRKVGSIDTTISQGNRNTQSVL